MGKKEMEHLDVFIYVVGFLFMTERWNEFYHEPTIFNPLGLCIVWRGIRILGFTSSSNLLGTKQGYYSTTVRDIQPQPGVVVTRC